MDNYLHPLNNKVFISSDAILGGRACSELTVDELDKRAAEERAKKFADWLRKARAVAGLNKAQLAKNAKIGRSYITNLEGAIRNALTDKPTIPTIGIVDRIAEALGVSKSEARLAAGYAAEPGETVADISSLELQRLSRYYNELPRECQLDFLALAESLWRRRRAEGRAERSISKSSGKHRPEVTVPGVMRPARKKKAS